MTVHTVTNAIDVTYTRFTKSGKVSGVRGVLGVATSGNKVEKSSEVARAFRGNQYSIIMRELMRLWPAEKIIKAGFDRTMSKSFEGVCIRDDDGDKYTLINITNPGKQITMKYCRAVTRHVAGLGKEVKGESVTYFTALSKWLADQDAYAASLTATVIANASEAVTA